MIRAFSLLAALLAGMMAMPAVAAEKIRVGFLEVFGDSAPRANRFDAEMARQLCETLGPSCELVQLETAFGLEELVNNRVDVLVSNYDSLAPDDRVVSTKEYIRIPLAFVTRKDGKLEEISPLELKGKNVAAGDVDGRGFLATRLPQSALAPPGDFLQALSAGKAELGVSKLDFAYTQMDSASSYGYCCKVAEVLPNDTSLDPGSRMLVRKSDKQLRKQIDKTIDEMERGGRIKAAGVAVFGFDVSPNAKADNPRFPSAPEVSKDIEPIIAERMVGLDTGKRWCSGVLVNGRAILSAAHCLTNGKSAVDVKPGRITLIQQGKKLARKVERIFVHPDYRASNTKEVGRNDIALLLLDENGAALPPLRFLTGREAFLATDISENLVFDAAQYGFGNRSVKDSQLVKSRARLRLIATPPDALLAGMLEAVEIISGELCQGDSGGGVFLAPGGFVDTEGPPLLLGIMSTAIITKAQCGNKGHIMRTDAYAGWITDILKP